MTSPALRSDVRPTRQRGKSGAGLALTLLCAAAGARAETLRCGSVLIEEGVTAGYVLAKCGEPESKTRVTEPVRARRPDGTTYVAGTVATEVWRYQRGYGKLAAQLTFADGLLKRIELEP